jgi:hypothetical protein
MKAWASIENGVTTGVWHSDAVPSAFGTWVDCGDMPPALGSTWNGSAFATAKPQRITSTQFLARLPQTVLPTLAASPSTLVLLITLAAAGDIDLADPEVSGGINSLVPSLLTAAQAAAVLDH